MLSLRSRPLGGVAITRPNAADFLRVPASSKYCYREYMHGIVSLTLRVIVISSNTFQMVRVLRPLMPLSQIAVVVPV